MISLQIMITRIHERIMQVRNIECIVFKATSVFARLVKDQNAILLLKSIQDVVHV